MLRRNASLLFVGLLLTIPIVNCGGSSHPKSIPVISGTLPNGNVGVAYTGMLTVTGGVAPFTWNITGLPTTLTFPPAGNDNTVTISGTPLSPVTVSGTAMVTDSKGTSSAAFPFSFMITSTLAITPTELSLMADTPVSQVLTVNPATMGPYTWTVISGALPPGNPALMLSNGVTADPKTIQTTTNTVIITGTPNTHGNFPFIIQVTDSVAPTPNTTQADYTGFVSNSNANACPTGNNNAGLPPGTSYAFLLRGFDATDDEPIVIAGSFTANGIGGVTAANVDYNGITLGPQNPGSSMNLAASLYSFSFENNDTRGCLSLVFNTDPAANRANPHKSQAQALPARRTSLRAQRANRPRREGVPATPPVPTRVVFQFALGGQTAGVYTTGNIIEFDNGDGATDSWAAGVMHLQDPTAFNVSSLAANFAFGLSGWDFNVSRAALAGSFTNAGGTLGPIFADFNDAGTLSGEVTGGSGVINTVSTTTGRATASLTVPGVLSAVDAVIYVLNANDFYVLLDDTIAANVPLLSGRALATSATFASGALNGFSVLASEGFDPNGSTNVVSVGTAQFSSTGNTATASFTQSDAGTVTNPTFTGTYTVDATNPSSGRVSFNVDSGTDTTPPVVYLTSGGDGIEQIQGFSVGQDTATSPTLPIAVSGILVTQSATAPAFTAASVSGTYALGNWEDVDGQNGSFSGVSTLAGTGAYSAVEDLNPFAPADGVTFLQPATPFSGTFTVTLGGTGTVTIGTNSDAFVTNGQQIFSIVPDPNNSTDANLDTYTNIVAP